MGKDQEQQEWRKLSREELDELAGEALRSVPRCR
jgi:hypothetical protein